MRTGRSTARPCLRSNCEQFFRRGVLQFATLVDHHNFRGGGFDIGDDVRGEDDDAFSRQIREQVAEADALFGVEPDGGFIDDEQLRVVEQRLGDADALLHPARVSAQRPLARRRPG